MAGETVDHAEPLVRLDSVSKQFPIRSGVLQRTTGHVHAVTDVTVEIASGETLGLVGESGSGKSTLGRVALGLLPATAGTVSYDGRDLARRRGRAARAVRSEIQLVFQDPYSSFDPLSSLASSVGEPLDVHEQMTRDDRRRRLVELAELVGLREEHLQRYPGQLSGGQLQRFAIARALASNPRFVVLDEPVSALDVSTQAQVLNLLERLQRELGVAYLLIAHNPAIVFHASHRIAVMYLGEIVEIGPAASVYLRPRHPYTEALLSAVPLTDPVEQRSRRRIVLHGSTPSPADPPSGCRFHTRCAYAMEICSHVPPEPLVAGDGTEVRCHLHTSGPTLEGRPLGMTDEHGASLTALSGPRRVSTRERGAR